LAHQDFLAYKRNPKHKNQEPCALFPSSQDVSRKALFLSL
jgi:hypothetical protein